MRVDQQELIDQSIGFEANDTNMMLDVTGMMDVYVRTHRAIPPWWSMQRDAYLRSIWKDGYYGSGLMYLAQTKLASIPMKIEAKDKSVSAHVRQAKAMTEAYHNNSGFGAGWYNTMLQFTEDYLGQDNGGFLEIIGGGPADGPIEGLPLGVRHLDASRCQRTSDPIYPVIYQGDDNHLYKIHAGRIFFMSQMPSAKASMRGVGYSSISRSVRILENLTHIINHKDEKMGARAASQILVGSGITGREIIKAIAAADAMMDNLGLSNYAKTVALGSTDDSIDLKRVELSSFSDFDEETSYTFASYALSLAWGLEFQEIMPIAGNKSSEIVALQRSRAKLPQVYTSTFVQQANLKLIPPYLEMTLDFQDDQADQQRAIIEDITSRNFQRQMESGVTTPEIVQQILHDRGYLTEDQLRSMQLSRGVLSNGSPVQSLYFDENYNDYLLIPRDLLVTRQNDPDLALDAIEANKVAIYALMGSTRNANTLVRSTESLAALEWLEKEYQPALFEPEEEPEEEDEEPEEEGEEDEEKALPATAWFRKNNQLRWKNL